MKANRVILGYFTILIIFIVLIVFFVHYNSPKQINGGDSGIFIDPQSAIDGVSIDSLMFRSTEEITPDHESNYVITFNFTNDKLPKEVEIIFPFNVTVKNINNYRVLLRAQKNGQLDPFTEKTGLISLNYTKDLKTGKYTTINSATENVSIFMGNEEVTTSDIYVINGNKLRIYFEENNTFTPQIDVSANVFKSTTPDTSILRIFQINTNPIHYERQDNLVFQNDNIVYVLDISRTKYQLDYGRSNFKPNIVNNVASDFNVEELTWNSNDMPGEGVLYLIDNKQQTTKNYVNILCGIYFSAIFGYFLVQFIGFLNKENN